jgi:hypothetical protein
LTVLLTFFYLLDITCLVELSHEGRWCQVVGLTSIYWVLTRCDGLVDRLSSRRHYCLHDVAWRVVVGHAVSISSTNVLMCSSRLREAWRLLLTQVAAEDEAERSLLRLCCDSYPHELVCRSRVSCMIELALAVLATTTVDDELSYVVLWSNVSYWFVYEGGHQLAGRVSWVLLGQVCVSRAVVERVVGVLVLLAAEGVDSLLQRQTIGHPWWRCVG